MTIDGIPVDTMISFCAAAFGSGLAAGAAVMWIVGTSTEKERLKTFEHLGENLITFYLKMQGKCKEIEMPAFPPGQLADLYNRPAQPNPIDKMSLDQFSKIQAHIEDAMKAKTDYVPLHKRPRKAK